MSRIEKKDVISDEALNSPLVLAQNYDQAILAIQKLMDLSHKSNAAITAAKSTGELSRRTKDLTLAEKELEKVKKMVSTAQARETVEYQKTEKQLIKLRNAQNERRKAARQQIKESKQLEGAYAREERKLRDLQILYRNQAVLYGVNSKQARNTKIQLDQLGKSMDKVNASARMGSSFVGRYSSALGSFGSQLLAGFGIYTGVAAVGMFGKAQLDLIKRLDGANKALQAITESSQEYNSVKLMLSDTAERYGVEIETLTRQYIKFQAAVKGTSLEGQEGVDMFRKLTKAGAVLSLSNEQMEGTFRAVEQMLSKGTVQAEEIRGQLSERLPGAYRILAQSMGITTMELGKQLKAGEVMAEDVLPKFADQLLITYGADKVEAIDTVTAAQNRLSNAWKEYVEDLDSGEGNISKAYKAILSGITSIIQGDFTFGVGATNNEGFMSSLGLGDKSLEELKQLSQQYGSEIRKIKSEWSGLTQQVGSFQGISKELAINQDLWNDSSKENRIALKGLKDEYDKLNPVYLEISRLITENTEATSKENEQNEKSVATLRALNEQLKDLKEQRLDAPKAEIAAFDKQIEDLEQRIKEFQGITDDKEAKKASDAKIRLFELETEQQAKNLDRQAQNESASIRERIRLLKESEALRISAIQVRLDKELENTKLTGDEKKLLIAQAARDIQNIEQKTDDQINGIRDKSLSEYLKRIKSRKEANDQRLEEEIEKEEEAARKIMEIRRSMTESILDLIFSLTDAIGAFSDRRIAELEKERDALKEKKDQELSIAGDNADAREAISKGMLNGIKLFKTKSTVKECVRQD